MDYTRYVKSFDMDSLKICLHTLKSDSVVHIEIIRLLLSERYALFGNNYAIKYAFFFII